MIPQRSAVTLRIRQNIWVAQVRFDGHQTTQYVFDSVDVDQSLLRELRVALLEGVDAALGVDHRLLPGEIGMARGAGVDRHLLLGGTGLDDVAARAGNRGVAVIRMDVFLHLDSLSLYEIERILYLII